MTKKSRTSVSDIIFELKASISFVSNRISDVTKRKKNKALVKLI